LVNRLSLMQAERHEGESEDAYYTRINREARDRYRLAHPGNWIQQWARDQSFWRDVASRTLSALIVAFLIFLFAVIAGFIKPLMLAGVMTPVVLFISLALSGYAIASARLNAAPGKSINVKHAWGSMTRVVLLVIAMLAVVCGSAWVLSLFWH
jgi:xanthine/uracil permease